MERRLAAILYADVVGYSRLMGDNEEATFRALTSHRRVIGGSLEQHHGRLVNSAGDSVLAEFASVVNAVRCGIEIQVELEAENANVPPSRRMQFRIGINLGEVLIDGEQLYGDGVNIAARLESLAPPGGICISGKVLDEARGKLALNYADQGFQKVKNIAEPVHVLRVLLNGAERSSRNMRWIGRDYWRRGLLSLVGLAIIVVTIALVPRVSLKLPRTSASIPPARKPALALPDRPSIAVLPFANMSGDREQEYFSDGITDDLITALSRLPGLFVIARESSFTYKGKAANVQDVGRELGVKYLLGGAVRKAAGQVRITVQLADAATGAELWAERYDRPLRDVFALQDEIVRRILTTLNLQLALAQQGPMIPRTTDNLEAYDDLLRGLEYLLGYTKKGLAKAQAMFEKAISLDPGYAAAYALLGWGYYMDWGLGFNPDSAGLEQGMRITQRALELDDALAFAHGVLAIFYIHNGQNAHLYERNMLNDQALTEAQRSIALDTNSAFGYSALAETLVMPGKHADALAAVEKAVRLDPRNSVNYMYLQAYAYSGLEQWKKAASSLKSYLGRYPDQIWAHHWLAIDYYNLHDYDGAREETAQVERLAALNPSGVAYSALAIALNVQDKPAEALAAAEKGMRFDPQNAMILSSSGWAYAKLRQWRQGLSAWKRYVALYPNDIGAHASLAGVYSSLGQMEAARREAAQVERAVALDPGSEYGHRLLAMALNATGRPADALAAAVKAMRLYPSTGAFPPYPLCEQGQAYTQLGRWNEGVGALNACLARHATDQIWPRTALAVDYIELGQNDAARKEVAEILKLDPQFSLRRALQSVYPTHKERIASDLAKAGLK